MIFSLGLDRVKVVQRDARLPLIRVNLHDLADGGVMMADAHGDLVDGYFVHDMRI